MDSLLGELLGALMMITGRFAVWLVSLGRWRAEPLFGEEGRIYGAAGGLSFVQNGRRIITQTGQLVAGIVLYGVFAGLALYAIAV